MTRCRARTLLLVAALGSALVVVPAVVTRGAEPASAAPPTIVRYFRVSVVSTGEIKSRYVGNKQAVSYKGTQVFSWQFKAAEIYEYGDFGSFSSAYLSQACYGSRRSTCSPATVSGRLTEAVNLVEDPNARTGGKTITCSRNDRLPKSGRGSAVRRFADTVGFDGVGELELDFVSALPRRMRDGKCWKGIGSHWISGLEQKQVADCEGGTAGYWATFGAYEKRLLYHQPPVVRAFRTSHDPIRFRQVCTNSLGLDHESYASEEHTTKWRSVWSVTFVPLKESQLEGAIKQLKEQT